MFPRVSLLLAILLSVMFPIISVEIALSQPVSFETIEKGDISQFRYDDPNFLGADMIIRDAKTWEWFWQQHTRGMRTLRPFPGVNFRTDIVLVAMLGFQSTGGGPSIEISSIEGIWGNPSADTASAEAARFPRGLRVLVKEDRERGSLTVITNPFHIVKVSNVLPHPFPIFRPRPAFLSVVFEHGPMVQTGSCTYNSTCFPNEYCAKEPGDCNGTGTCTPKPDVCIAAEIASINPVCGCDGVTYGNACLAAVGGVNVLHAGRCEGVKCASNNDCSSVEFCLAPDGKCPGVDTPGTCVPRPQMCPLTFACLPIVCGCDGNTYCDLCNAFAAGTSILHTGMCTTKPPQ